MFDRDFTDGMLENEDEQRIHMAFPFVCAVVDNGSEYKRDVQLKKTKQVLL